MSDYVTRQECTARFENLSRQIENLSNKVQKLDDTLTGNGGEGLVMEVRKMSWRNQLIDKGTSLLIGIAATLLTLWLTGTLHIVG